MKLSTDRLLVTYALVAAAGEVPPMLIFQSNFPETEDALTLINNAVSHFDVLNLSKYPDVELVVKELSFLHEYKTLRSVFKKNALHSINELRKLAYDYSSQNPRVPRNSGDLESISFGALPGWVRDENHEWRHPLYSRDRSQEVDVVSVEVSDSMYGGVVTIDGKKFPVSFKQLWTISSESRAAVTALQARNSSMYEEKKQVTFLDNGHIPVTPFRNIKF